MGSVISAVKVSFPGIIKNKNYVSAASLAARSCLSNDYTDRPQVELLINTGVYRDQNLVEPALSALILGKLMKKSYFRKAQFYKGLESIQSLDLNNGASALIQAIQLTSAKIENKSIRSGLIVAGDYISAPSRAHNYPFNNSAAAILLSQGPETKGFLGFKTKTFPQFNKDFAGYGQFINGKQLLTVEEEKGFLKHAVECSYKITTEFLEEQKLKTQDIDIIIASMYPRGFLSAYGEKTKMNDKIIRIPDKRKQFHTASPLIALNSIFNTEKFRSAKNILFLTVGSGLNVSIALYKQ